MYYCRVLFLSVVCAGSLLTQIRAADVAVSVRDNFFDPRNVTINVNDQVTWTWAGRQGHSSTGPGTPPLWNSYKSSGTFSFVFSTPGVFNYYCYVIDHIGMNGSVTVQVPNTPPSVTITNPVNDAVFIAPATFTVDASASDPDGSVSQVQFFLASTSLGTDTVSPYSANVNNLPAGTYTLSAVATDNQSARATNSITVIVNPTFSDANWSPLGSGVGHSGWTPTVYALAASGNDLYAGGDLTSAGGTTANYVAKWNGTSWTALGSGVYHDFDPEGASTTVWALAVSGGDLYAGGYFTLAGSIPATNIAKWNGTSWSALGSGIDVQNHRYVFALAVSGSDLYVGGLFREAGGSPATNIAKWDGNSWSALGAGINMAVNALAVSGSDLYAGGHFRTAGGSPATNIAKWDGSSWSALGSGMNGEVNALAISGSDLYAGGAFTMAGGTPANRIAKWDGSSWSALGSGMNGRVSALAVSGSDLYAGGGFTIAGGSPATNIAKWNGSNWSALGSGMGGITYPSVSALAVSSRDLYAGGRFTTAGGTPANYIAKARIRSAAESITASGSSATIQFSGVVGYQYHVQRTDSLTPPMWTTITTTPLSPAGDGSLIFTDTTAPPGTAYYRLLQH